MPQISVIGGPCAGGAAYSPALGDITVMAGPEARMFLTGPAVVEKVTRERITAMDLGGPKVHGKNGVAHLVADDDVHAAELVRAALAHLPSKAGGALPLHPPRARRRRPGRACCPSATARSTTCATSSRALVDAGEMLELGPRWARNLVVGLARIEGAPVGVIANQPHHLGGCLDAESSQKGAWFVDLCDRFGVPLVVLVDTPGLPSRASAQEKAGVIRHGASLLRAFSVATTPRVTVTLRQAYGGAHIVMNSRDLGANLTLAWPDAKIGVMGAVAGGRDHASPRDRGGRRPGRAGRRLRGRAPAGRGRGEPRLRRRDHRALRDARAHRLRAGGRAVTPAAAAARRAVQSRNATEEAILDAAREALAESRSTRLTMDAIARKAFVSAAPRSTSTSPTSGRSSTG